MADIVTSQTTLDGDRNLVMIFNSVSDGTRENGVLKVDVSALTPRTRDGAVCTGVRIKGVKYQISGKQVSILWDATTDVEALILSDSGDQIFTVPIGNNAGAGKTGDILFTTRNGSAGDSYSIELHMLKSYG